MDYVDLPDADFRNVHSRTISIAGGDTVMTFDGNNEIEVPVKLGKLRYRNYQVYLKVGNIEFANDKPSGKGTCGLEQPAAYLGKFYFDESVQSIAPRVVRGSVQKSQTPYVERVRNNMIIRNGERSYRLNGAGITP